MNDQSATILYRVASTMTEVVAKADAVTTRAEAMAAAERRRNYPLLGILLCLFFAVSVVGYEVHELTAFLKTTVPIAAPVSQTTALTAR